MDRSETVSRGSAAVVGGCPDCGQALSDRYCASCGLDQQSVRPTVRVWLAQLADEFFALDGKFPRTVAMLFTRPGKLTTEWIAGRRSAYTRPLGLYLFSAFLFFGVGVLSNDPGQSAIRGIVDGFYASADSPPSDAEIARIATSAERNLPRVMIAVLPIAALLFKLLFPTPGGFYVGYLVFTLHLHALFYLLRAIEIAVPEPMDLLSYVSLGGGSVYLYLSARRVFEYPRVRTVLRLLVFGAGYLAALIAITLLLSILMASLTD